MRILAVDVHDTETGERRTHRYARSPVTLGRNPRNDLHLDFGFVSGRHATIRFDEHGGVITDLGSTNGTSVAGRRLAPRTPRPIGAGIHVRIGKLELALRFDVAGTDPLADELGAGPPARSGSSKTRATVPMPAARDPRASEAGEPPPARPPGGEVTGLVDLGGVHRLLAELRPAHAEWEAARSQLRERLRGGLDSLPAGSRAPAIALLRRELPGLAAVQGSGLDVDPSDADPGDLASVAGLARGLLGDVAPPVDLREQAAFLARVRDVLDTAAQAFVEICAVQGRFGDEMGVRTVREFTPLHAAADARGVLAYLLDWRRGGPERTAQLAAVYGDFVVHQVALVHGVVEGVEAVLERLQPLELERGVVSLNKGATAWRRYTERYAEIIEDRGIAALVFGPEFARAYARVGAG